MTVQHVVKPYLLAARGTNFSLKFTVPSLNRLSDMLSSDKGIVRATFDFFADNFGSKINIVAQHEVKVLCQRCRTEVSVRLTIDSEILLVRSEELLAEVPDEVDAIVVEDEMSLKRLIEDELILAMPIFSRHESDQCPTKQYNGDDKSEGTYRPFANLKDKWSN